MPRAWLDAPDATYELVRTREDTPKGHIPLAALGGPAEVSAATGIPRGSIGYRMERGELPQPVLQLDGIRLWDMRQITRTRTD